MSVSEIIKTRRLSLGLSMKDLADKIGVSEATISRWESGDIENMRRDKIASLSEVLSVSPYILLGIEPASEPPTVEFAKALKTLRTGCNLSQSALADALQCSKSAVSMWENGTRTPDFDMLVKLADFFCVSTDFLLGRSHNDACYLDHETTRCVQIINTHPTLRAYIQASDKVTPEDLNKFLSVLDVLINK